MNLIEKDEQLREWQARLLFPVHDEVLIEVPEQHGEQTRERVEYLMKQPFKEKFSFELAVEAGIGHNWMEAKR
jgi:DNA polymerase I-like protein with 3'-5' exonuclease and polymerase domains